LRRIFIVIVDLEWLWLLALLPAVILIQPNLTPLLLLPPLFWALRKWVYGRFVTPTPLDSALLLLLIMLLVSLYATFDMAFSLDKIAGLLLGVALFYAVAAAAARSQRWLAAAVMLHLSLGVGVAFLGMLGTRWSNKLPLVGDLIAQLPARLLAVPGGPDGFNPNQVAGVLLWVGPLALALTWALPLNPGWFKGRWRWPGWIGACLLVGGAAGFILGVLLLTQSRSALIGLAVASSLVLLAVSWLRSPRFVVAAGLLLVIVGVGVWLSPLDWAALRAPADTLEIVDDQLSLRSLDGRVEIWSRALYGLQDFPFTGMGMGTFRRVVHILYPLFLISPTTDIAHAHNHLLQTGLDLGIPGLVAYLAIWLGAAVMLWQSWRATDKPWLRVLTIGFAGSLAAYFIYGLTDAVALGAKPGFIFWYLLGLVTALRQLTCRPIRICSNSDKMVS
jgi:putative inorganic carbon (hco3(-)) transporter